jgi:hypothetical protein
MKFCLLAINVSLAFERIDKEKMDPSPPKLNKSLKNFPIKFNEG